MSVSILLYMVALILFGFAAFVPVRANLGWLGMACVMLGYLLGVGLLR